MKFFLFKTSLRYQKPYIFTNVDEILGIYCGRDELNMLVCDNKSYPEFESSTTSITAQHFCRAVRGWCGDTTYFLKSPNFSLV